MDAVEHFADVFIGRQPVLDREQVTIGYELLFRTSADHNAAQVTDGRAATADVVCKAFAELGLAEALGTQRAFINVATDLLFADALEFLPPRLVVLEVLLHEGATPEAIERCRELRARGYELCLSANAGMTDAVPALHQIASYVRIDVNDMPAEALTKLVGELKSPSLKLIAGRVESREQTDLCRQLGFDFFQGYHFDRPVIIEGRKLPAATRSLMRLIDLLEEDADIAALENAFKSEPALTVNLLRLTNSVGAGLAVRIGSVRHAITVLGRRQLQRWLQLLLFSGPGGNAGIAGNPLMQWAALRGRFMELLAARAFPAKKESRDKAFIAGLMSLMPQALGLPIAEILAQIALAREVRQALTEHEGDIGKLLELSERYDDNDVEGTVALFRHFGGRLSLQSLALCLAEALTWVGQLCTETDR